MAAPAHRTERLLNLVICLLSTRSWLTKEQIRSAVPQYAECTTSEAFDRMFERDKEDLRELGVPLVTGSHSSWFEDEQGYRLDRTAYALPDLEVSAAEVAGLGVAPARPGFRRRGPGRPRARQPRLAAGEPRRPRGPRAGQAQGPRRPDRR